MTLEMLSYCLTFASLSIPFWNIVTVYMIFSQTREEVQYISLQPVRLFRGIEWSFLTNWVGHLNMVSVGSNYSNLQFSWTRTYFGVLRKSFLALLWSPKEFAEFVMAHLSLVWA